MDKKKGRMTIKRDSISAEEEYARSRRMKWRFRAAVRFVMENIYWLEDVEDQELGLDVQKNIILLTKKKEKKSLLSLTEKGILNKRAEHRTEQEKMHLSRVIGGLKCFRRYPNHVKSQLAGVTYFYYFPPGRTIVQQGHESYGMYFIITGEVNVFQEHYDPLMNVMVVNQVAVVGAGNMFGEVSLLHDIPRTGTIVTNTHCEFLCLRKTDFELILKATVQQQWEEVKKAMSTFSYFDHWGDIAVRECCMLAKMKAYFPDQTILGDGYGLTDYVYFVLKGSCQVIEHLQVTWEMKGGEKRYHLYEPPPLPPSAQIMKKTSLFNVRADASETNELYAQLPKVQHTSKIFNVLSTTGNVDIASKLKLHEERRRMSEQQRTLSITIHESAEGDNLFPNKSDIKSSASRNSSNDEANMEATRSSSGLPLNVETHFMQVCFLNPTACFGIGEHFENRRIVAKEYTECLLIPRYWILQKNKANIWNRVQQFLNNHIPKTKQIFKRFVAERKWVVHRKHIVKDILSQKNIPNDNIVNNVPFYIRIHEELQD